MQYQFALLALYCMFLCTIVLAEDLSSGTNGTFLELKDQAKSINVTTAEKLKRLKALRAEVKSLTAELRGNKIEEIITGSKKNSTASATKKKDGKQWKRLKKRIRQLSRRLSKLERAVIAQQESIKSGRDKKNGHRLKSSTVLPSVQNTTTNHQQPKSRPGYHKSVCKIHNDCLPGHCCHKSEEASQCIRHALNETNVCRHSCQCDSHLQCFRQKTNDDNVGHSYCKRAHVNDFALGTYENTKQGIFDA